MLTMSEPMQDPTCPYDWAKTDPQLAEAEVAPTYSRRNILKYGIAGVIALGGLGTALYMESTSDDTSDRSEGSSRDVPLPEQMTQPERKSDYRLEDLIDYAANTEFAEPEPLRLSETIKAIAEATDLGEAKINATTAIEVMTGKKLTFNIDPDTGEEMVNTRKNDDPGTYMTKLAGFVSNIGRRAKKLVSMPSSYNVFEEYSNSKTSDGRDSVDINIGGMVIHTTDSNELTMDMGSLDNTDILDHELMHEAQFAKGNYEKSSDYTKLREYGNEKFGSVKEMQSILSDLYGKGELNEFTYQAAFELVRNEDSRPDARYEDESYTLNTTSIRGILQKSTNEFLTYLRMKQLQAITDMSEAAGCDFGAQMAYVERFGNTTHPATLASIAASGIIEHISPHEGSVLGADDRWSQTPLSPGTHFINIGTEEKPEIIVLTGNGVSVESQDDDAIPNGVFEIVIVNEADKSDVTINLDEPAPSTTSTTSTLPSSESVEVIESSTPFIFIPQPTSPYVDRVLKVIAPQLVDPNLYQVTDNAYGPTSAPIDPEHPMERRRLSVRTEFIMGFIDPSKVIGKIGDDYLYQSLV